MSLDVRQIVGIETLQDPRVRQVVAEVCALIQATFPDAQFQVSPNTEHRGAIVEVYTDSDDVFAVLDVVSERRVDLLVGEDIAIRIWPAQRAWRSLAH